MVALEAFIASKEVLVRRPAPPSIRPFLENKRPIQTPRKIILVSSQTLRLVLNFGSGPEGPKLEGQQADRKFKAAGTRRKDQPGTQARVAMEGAIA